MYGRKNFREKICFVVAFAKKAHPISAPRYTQRKQTIVA